VFELPMAYACEKSTGPAKNCDFRSGKIILQQTVSREQMQKLLETGSTDLLTDFISNKNRRKFSAFLVRDPSGKVVFKFQEKKPKAVETPVKAVSAKAPPAKKALVVAKKKPSRAGASTKRKAA
jgi:DNA topoisomerase-3